ncbi:MAG: hypothetical protein IRY94_05100 [Rhodospirillaceae bacterium]|nr:hypothetical protein [Rhodospirillaceae bacterium]
MTMTDTTKLHRFAAQIADTLSRGKPPPITSEMVDYAEEQPTLLLDSLEAFAQQLARGDEEGENLATAYLLLMSAQMQALRQAVDAPFDWAVDLKKEFEASVAELVRSGELEGQAMSLIAAAMREAGLAPGPELMAASQALLDADSDSMPEAGDPATLLAQLAAQAGDDTFALLDGLRDAMHTLPPEPLAAIAAQLAAGPVPALREAGALLVLHAEKAVRRGVAMALNGAAESISPTTLRRLILVRGWLPDDERPLIDQVVRAARTKGVDCAPWEARAPSQITASAIDGAGAQMLFALSRQGKRQRVSAVLLKEEKGIADAWCRGPLTKREVDEMIGDLDMPLLARAVSRPYADRIVCHSLGAGLDLGLVPPPGLVDVAESIGALDWRPARLAWRQLLDELIEALPASALSPEGVEAAIGQSLETAEASGLLHSWFESDQEVEDLLADAPETDTDGLVQLVLDRVITPRQEKWVERLLWVALWLKEGDPDLQMRWSDFAVLAREMVRGRALGTIPLMREIALQTVEAVEG